MIRQYGNALVCTCASARQARHDGDCPMRQLEAPSVPPIDPATLGKVVPGFYFDRGAEPGELVTASKIDPAERAVNAALVVCYFAAALVVIAAALTWVVTHYG